MRKPGIPTCPKTPGRERFDGALKECLETIMGRRDSTIKPLPADATQADIIAKLNALIDLLQ